ncbi:MAG TPA: IS200/IS605 family transposase [Acidobacteriota bacterium]|jgi:REP element-mobilizing transposase RayT|nr:IS200/IS605 family transposase [Acidobacteriota bacterium]
MAHTLTDLIAHIVFSTKNRHPFIDAELKDRLFPYLGGIVRQLGGKCLIVNGVADHVHLLVHYPPMRCVSKLLGILKSNSTGWVRETWPRRLSFAWQTGYSAFSVSQSNTSDVYNYIANQERHHRRISFQDELRMLLQKHQIAYDERFLWD